MASEIFHFKNVCLPIRHLKIEKGAGAEMCFTTVSGIVTGDALV